MDTNRNIISPINCCSNTIHKKSDGFSNQITLKLNAYLRERSLSDPQWSKAISSQYFLIETANILNLTTINSYQELEEEFFNTSCIFRKGVVQPSPQKILVVPDENEKLIERMQEEENSGKYYKSRLRANKINTKEKKDRIFYNYYYGLMVGIINRFCTNDDYLNNYSEIRSIAISELFNSEAIDEADGWIHFRLPWITARILISLSSYSEKTIIDLISSGAFSKSNITNINEYRIFIKKSADSLITRLHGKSLWESGAGDWVTCWESTGLCLEALYSLNLIDEYKSEITNVINYLFLEENLNRWLVKPAFNNEKDSNQTLASVILASVIYRLMNSNKIKNNNKIKELIEKLFENISTELQKIDEEKVQQYCTIPQIIYYIIVAINGGENEKK